MAYIPKAKNLKADSVSILNYLRDNGTQNYRDMVPKAEATQESVQEIGGIVMSYNAIRNEFLNALYNRIARVIITSKMYSNPWKWAKKGILEHGETIEEIFVNLAKPYDYNPERDQLLQFKRHIPSVLAAFHHVNSRIYYPNTIGNDELRTAFLSWQGVDDLIARIVNSMYSSYEYDEFQLMKYMLAKNIVNGRIVSSAIPAKTATNTDDIVANVKGISNLLEFMSSDYNQAGVLNYTNKDDQFVIINAKFDATMNVKVLATAFNMERAEFMGHRVLIDSFGALDQSRLKMLMTNEDGLVDPGYTEFTNDQLEDLDAIPMVIVSRDYFQVYDQLLQFTENYNAKTLEWNYFLHAWRIFSVSPFANAVLFQAETQTITSVNITPATITTVPGQAVQFSVSVVGTNFAPLTVNWSVSGNAVAGTSINSAGLLTIAQNETAKTLTVTATSTFDNTKSGTATVTLS